MTLYSGNGVQVERKFSDFAILHRCTACLMIKCRRDFSAVAGVEFSLSSGFALLLLLFFYLCVPELPTIKMKTLLYLLSRVILRVEYENVCQVFRTVVGFW